MIRVPDTVGPVGIVTDVRAGRISCSVGIEAPRQGRPLTRVNWILRQLKDATGNLRIEAYYPGSRDAGSAELLSVARQKPNLLVADPARDIRSFKISLSAPLGTKRGLGKGTFITSTVETLEKFYEEVVQNLREWRSSADISSVETPSE